jgi:hypothetical protein
MIADVVYAVIVGMNVIRGVVPIDGKWRLVHSLGQHLPVVVFHLLLQIEAQNVLLSACYAG